MPYVFVGPHPDTLGGGEPLELDQVVHTVDFDDPHNQALIAKGWLIEHVVPRPRPTPARDQSTEEAE
jgi:hypothetical protein